MKLITVIGLAVLLTACQTNTVTKPRLETFNIPSELLDCKDRKVKVPVGSSLKNKEVTQYITKLRRVLNECQLDVGTIEQLTKEYNALVEKFNEENK